MRISNLLDRNTRVNRYTSKPLIKNNKNFKFVSSMDDKKAAGEALRKMIGSEIKRCRTEAGMTQQELADKIGYARMSVSKIENGTESVSINTLALICKALKLEPLFLLRRK